MNDLKIGDKVTVHDSGPTEFKVVHIKPQPGDDGFIYLCESSDGVRVARYASQVTKVD